MGETKFCTNCGARVEEGARFCKKCGQPILQEENIEATEHSSEPPKKHHSGGVIAVVAIVCAVVFCGIGIYIGLQLPEGNTENSSENENVEKTEEKEPEADQEAEPLENVSSNNNQNGGKTNTFTATAADGVLIISNGMVNYNENGSATVTTYEENLSSYDLSYGWDEGYQMDLQLSNGKTCSIKLEYNSIMNAGDFSYSLLNFNGIDADIEQIIIYPVYTLSSHGIPENIDNGYKVVYTVTKTG